MKCNDMKCKVNGVERNICCYYCDDYSKDDCITYKATCTKLQREGYKEELAKECEYFVTE